MLEGVVVAFVAAEQAEQQHLRKTRSSAAEQAEQRRLHTTRSSAAALVHAVFVAVAGLAYAGAAVGEQQEQPPQVSGAGQQVDV